MFLFLGLFSFLVIVSSGKGTATIVRTLRTPIFGGVDVRRGEIHSKKEQTIYMEGGGWGGVINQMEEGEKVGVDANTE